ncbi:MAG: hypothetical protein GY793_12110 [Proteobacteria bacterium]|nr:hypothetical protein [Pseudomonadota bacterium]
MTFGDLQYESFHYFTFLRRTNRTIFSVVLTVYLILYTALTILFIDANIVYKIIDFIQNVLTYPKELLNIINWVDSITNNVEPTFRNVLIFGSLKFLLTPVFIRRTNDTDLHWAFSIGVAIFCCYDFCTAIYAHEQTTLFNTSLNNIYYSIILLLFILPTSNKEDFV